MVSHNARSQLPPQSLNHSYIGHPPAAALFATQTRYKREAFRGSEFAPRVLADADIQVVMKVSDDV